MIEVKPPVGHYTNHANDNPLQNKAAATADFIPDAPNRFGALMRINAVWHLSHNLQWQLERETDAIDRCRVPGTAGGIYNGIGNFRSAAAARDYSKVKLKPSVIFTSFGLPRVYVRVDGPRPA